MKDIESWQDEKFQDILPKDSYYAIEKSVLGNKDLEDDTKVTITDYKQINLGEIDFEKLRKEFPKKAYKSIEFTDLKEFMEIKLKQMTARNKTKSNFLEDFERVIDEYNNGNVEVEEAYETLIKQIEKLNEEEKRYIKEGFISEYLPELYDAQLVAQAKPKYN